jgi:two-component system NtrC family response regulator
LGATQEVGSDFRLIAATNRNLEGMAQAGTFRDDLLYRVRSFQIDLPPLRDRMEEIQELACFHVEKICRKYRITDKELSSELLDAFRAYRWPGNVRELVNTLESAVGAAGDETILFPHHLPENVRIKVARAMLSRSRAKHVSANPPAADLVFPPADVVPAAIPSWDSFRKETIETAEKQYLSHLFEKSGNDLKGALLLSGLSRSRLYEILKKHQMAFPA